MITFRATFHSTLTSDATQQALEHAAYCATEDKTIVEGCKSAKASKTVARVTVDFLALNRNEATATATFVQRKLGHVTATDEGFTLRQVRES